MQGLVVPDSTNAPIVSNEPRTSLLAPTITATTTIAIEGYQINNLDLSVL